MNKYKSKAIKPHRSFTESSITLEKSTSGEILTNFTKDLSEYAENDNFYANEDIFRKIQKGTSSSPILIGKSESLIKLAAKIRSREVSDSRKPILLDMKAISEAVKPIDVTNRLKAIANAIVNSKEHHILFIDESTPIQLTNVLIRMLRDHRNKRYPLIFLDSNTRDYSYKKLTLQRVSKGYWQDPVNCRRYMDALAKEIGIREYKDWYNVRSADLIRNIPSVEKFLKNYKFSLINALKSVYPEFDWITWNFREAPKGFWQNKSSRLDYLNWLAKEVGVSKLNDWYNVNFTQIRKPPGLTANYGSFANVLMATYPEFDWEPWKFSKQPRYMWSDKSIQLKYIKYIEQKFNIKERTDWYGITKRDLIDNHGRPLLLIYDNSLYKLLQSIYPDSHWQPWSFRVIDQYAWKDPQQVRSFLDLVKDTYRLKTISDWHMISNAMIEKIGGKTLLMYNKGLQQVLQHYYPDYKWKQRSDGLKHRQKKTQSLLERYLKEIFPTQRILSDHFHKNINMQLDVFIPELNTAFEYQGEHHFEHHFLFGNPSIQQLRDQRKREKCKELNITLIEIPYWWDLSIGSLVGTIKQIKPELLQLNKSIG